MRILIIHQYYLAPGDPGGSRFNEFARMWADAGHEVTVVTGNLNYATGRRVAGTQGRWHTRVNDGPVRLWRCHVPLSYSRGYVGRMWAFAGFTLAAATALMRIDRPDVIIATSPPLTVAIPGWIASTWRRRRIPWVFEIRDLWPESAITTGVLAERSLLARLLYRLERAACGSADRVNVLTPAFAENLKNRGLADAARILFVPNGADADLFRPRFDGNGVREEFGWGDRIVAIYAGAHGRANALQQLIEAADRLRERPDILIVSVGDGPERAALERAARVRGLTNISFLGPQPKERMPRLVSAADIGLAVLQDNPTFRTVYPNKVFDYMACARPVVLAIDGVARQLVCDDARAGVFVQPEDAGGLARALTNLADDPSTREQLGTNGRAWVIAHATREVLASRYLGALTSLAGAEPPSPTRLANPTAAEEAELRTRDALQGLR